MAVGRVEYVPKLSSIFVKAIKGYPAIGSSQKADYRRPDER
jgi:hypothetical protein